MQMVEFQQWLGFLLIMSILTVGFWILFFLMSILPYWIFGALKEQAKDRKAAKEQKAA